MSKRYLTPVEINKEMDFVRETMGFKGAAEKSGIKLAVNMARNNTKINDKVIMVIEPHMVHMPTWQRKTDTLRSNNIGRNYSSYKWELPKVIVDKGVLVCVDGQHRIYGAFSGGVDTITVELLDGLTMEQAIDLFLDQTQDRRHMTPSDIYKAAVEAKRPDYLMLKNICEKNRVAIKDDDSLKNPIGVLTSISDGISLTRSNPELLDRMLKLISKTRWTGATTGNPYSAKVIRVLKRVYAKYGNDFDKIENVLLSRCSGPNYFESFYNQSMEAMFDEICMNMDAGTNIADFPMKAKSII